MKKAIVAIGAATVNVLTKWLKTNDAQTYIVWIGSHQHDFTSLNMRQYIGDIVSETSHHVIGTRGELFYMGADACCDTRHYEQRVQHVLANYEELYVLSSLGGTTTSHVTPAIARVLTAQHAHVQAIVTLPAKLEPRTRHEKAQQAFEQLQHICPMLHLVTNNGEQEESLVATFARRDVLLATLLQRLIG